MYPYMEPTMPMYPTMHMHHHMPPPFMHPGVPYMNSPMHCGYPVSPNVMCRHNNNPMQQHAAEMAQAMNTPARKISPNASFSMTTPHRSTQIAGLHTGSAQQMPATEKHGKFCTRVERELGEAQKDELIEMLMELSSLNPEVASFVESKAQLFGLRSPTMSNTSPISSLPYEHMPIVSDCTPNKPTKTDTDAATPHSPMEELHHDLHQRHTAPDTRAFSEDKHPCLRAYSNCRYPQSCIFAQCPRNLCLNFVRGQCANGQECPMVHRLPADAPAAVTHLFNISHTTDRESAADGSDAAADSPHSTCKPAEEDRSPDPKQ